MAQLLNDRVVQMFRLTDEPGGLGLSCTRPAFRLRVYRFSARPNRGLSRGRHTSWPHY
jgi:hypothetical protein